MRVVLLMMMPCLVTCQLEYFFGGGASAAEEGDPSKALELTDRTFDAAVLGEDALPHFVEFYTPWCHHCVRLAPTWDALAEELAGKVGIAKVDCTSNTRLRTRYMIQGFPTLMLFQAGRQKEFRGNRDKKLLVSWLLQQHAIPDEDDGGERIKLHSWSHRGESDSIRLALLEAGLPFTDRVYNSTAELDKRRAALDVVFTPVGRTHLPILKVEYESYPSVHAALLYLAREHDLYGKGAAQMALVDMVMAHVAQASRRYERMVYADGIEAPELPHSDSCVSWRQTEECSASGPRQPISDRPCKSVVEEGWSGYCECQNGRKVKEVGCGHESFSCQEACMTEEEKETNKMLVREAKAKSLQASREAYNKDATNDLKALERVLQRNQKKFPGTMLLVGEKLTVADLYAFDQVTRELGVNEAALDDVPLLKEWFVETGVRDAIMNHLSSLARPKHPNGEDAIIGNEKNPENIAANPFLV